MTGQATDFATRIISRTETVVKLREHNLEPKWTAQFTMQQLINCCNRMDQALEEQHPYPESVQQELIQNERFASYYHALMELFDADMQRLVTEGLTGTANAQRNTFPSQLSKLIAQCREANHDITAFPQQHVMDVLRGLPLDAPYRLTVLVNILPYSLSRTERDLAIHNIQNCVAVPIDLNEWQQRLLREPLVKTRQIFQNDNFVEVAELMEQNPTLLSVARLLHDRGVPDDLTLADYQTFVADADERFLLMQEVIAQMDSSSAGQLMCCWSRNGYTLSELRRILQIMEREPNLDWGKNTSTYSAYVNLLYGMKYKVIELSQVDWYLENLLTYAIVKNKKHFIRIVDAHGDAVCTCTRNALLLNEALYKEHLNINDLSERDLLESLSMVEQKLAMNLLQPGRCYTFTEIKALYDLPPVYVQFYNALTSPSQDYRLLVLRQLAKRRVLDGLTEEEATALASMLDVKPIYRWMEEELGHIEYLQLHDGAQLLAHYDKVRHLIPGMTRRPDALHVLHNMETAIRFCSIAEIKEHLLQEDMDWSRLAQRMELSPQFIAKHRTSICDFLFENGANIANTYISNLCADEDEKSFLKVVKAELMGQLRTLKYFGNDLHKELDILISDQIMEAWKVNTSSRIEHIMFQERDDFFSTMLLGDVPCRTCLSYMGGAYCECLLSGFDSNKKVLYAEMNGLAVGRAYLRLTKGNTTGVSPHSGPLGFVDLEDAEAFEAEKANEELVLFLERPYIKGVSNALMQRIQEGFIQAAEQKAASLGCTLVLSMDYKNFAPQHFVHTKLYMYISKSKAGAQYLDSLGGEATVTTEGKYRPEVFLVKAHNNKEEE